MHTPNISIGIDFLGKYKIFDYTSSFEELCLRTKSEYDLSEEEMKNPQFSYTDEEGDEVNISNSFDLENGLLYAISENLKVLYLHLETVSVLNNDFINETTESIKYSEEKDIIHKDVDFKLNNLFSKEKITICERQRLINLCNKKINKVREDFFRIISVSAKNFKESALKPVKSKFADDSRQDKNIYTKKVCERTSKDLKTKYLLNENELNEIMMKVFEEELESMKSMIIEKSIDKAMKIIKEKNKIEEGVLSLEDIQNIIECGCCKRRSIKACRCKCTVNNKINFCKTAEFQLGKQPHNQFLKIRKYGKNVQPCLVKKKEENSGFAKIEAQKINENFNNLRSIVSRIIENGNANRKKNWNFFSKK